MKDLKDFTVGLHPEFNQTRCFFVVKNDGTREDFSFHKCISNLIDLKEKGDNKEVVKEAIEA